MHAYHTWQCYLILKSTSLMNLENVRFGGSLESEGLADLKSLQAWWISGVYSLGGSLVCRLGGSLQFTVLVGLFKSTGLVDFLSLQAWWVSQVYRLGGFPKSTGLVDLQNLKILLIFEMSASLADL